MVIQVPNYSYFNDVDTMTLVYLKEKIEQIYNNVCRILLILFIVGMASAKQFLIVRNLTPKNNQCAKTMKTLCHYQPGYFFVHTFFFDFLSWSIGFF